MFSVWPFRFHSVASEDIFFPAGKASNILHGAFGHIFRKLACGQDCSDAKSCTRASECPYALCFEPRTIYKHDDEPHAANPSGLADWPRPFVFRALHLDGRTVKEGEPFYFDLVLFPFHSPDQ